MSRIEFFQDEPDCWRLCLRWDDDWQEWELGGGTQGQELLLDVTEEIIGEFLQAVQAALTDLNARRSKA